MESTQKMADAMVLKGLTVRKITAKLRDAVIISFQSDGDEPGRYKNIEIPEAVRDLPVEDFYFAKSAEGRLEFVLEFGKGVLPRPMPAARPKVTRGEKSAKKAQQVLGEAPKPKAPDAPATGANTPASALVADKPKDEPKPATTPATVAKTPAPTPTADKPKDDPKPATTPATATKAPAPAADMPEAKKPDQPTKK